MDESEKTHLQVHRYSVVLAVSAINHSELESFRTSYSNEMRSSIVVVSNSLKFHLFFIIITIVGLLHLKCRVKV